MNLVDISESSEKLTDENRKLQIQFLEQKQRLEEMNDRLKFYSRENEYNVAELTEALLLIKKRKSSGELGFLQEEVQEEQEEVQELRAAHAETIQELQKTRSLLNMESSICRDYKLSSETWPTAANQRRPPPSTALMKRRMMRSCCSGGENLLELQLLGASLSSSAMQEALGDQDPSTSSTFSTFCTYSFHLSELHCTPLASGSRPRYGFTPFVVSVDEGFLQYLRRGAVKVDCTRRWASEETPSFGSLEYRLRLRVPMKETLRTFILLRPQVPSYCSDPQVPPYCSDPQVPSYCSDPQVPPYCSDPQRNELCVAVQRCTDLQSSSSSPPSPYVVYKFYEFPDHPTATAPPAGAPAWRDRRLFPVLMDAELHRYLQSKELLLYVFDYNEQRMDTYLGKTRVPLLPLSRDQGVSGQNSLSALS
ncbi:hypothetical protein F7725_013636 [Dissostichus mawsoni]|uniref:C2 domain-containing protein n=1 Tax=Dissostichus mawsoni TaxID=36200 RepID=A0A7J5YXU5_DISMA|nr:hypothetical protein F7725_013636 [Dissostichus mawsoni]